MNKIGEYILAIIFLFFIMSCHMLDRGRNDLTGARYPKSR